ncbi:MAG: SDR family oxidoreductase [Halodesulfurarchaeum sp.]
MEIVIVGCGYVGLELARQLATRGHDVSGIRRSESGLAAVESAGDGVQAVRADVTDPDSLAALPDADAVVFAASSGGGGPAAAREIYVEGLRNVLAEYDSRARTPDRLVYTSSSGVYGDHDGQWVDEDTPIEPSTEKTRVLAAAEAVAIEETAAAGIDGTVVRFAGLYGPGRYRLERYLTGPVTAGYLNMVHRADAAGAVTHLLETDAARGAVVLAVDDEPVEKHRFADWLADAAGVPRPAKQSKDERLAAGDLSTAAKRRIRTEKRLSNDRLHDLGYEFSVPTFREGYAEAVEAWPEEV